MKHLIKKDWVRRVLAILLAVAMILTMFVSLIPRLFY